MVTSQTTTAQNKAIYQRFIDEVFNQGKLDLVDELLSPSYVLHDAAPDTPEGPDAVRQIVTMFRAAFPDLQITLEALICEGDLVSARSTMRGSKGNGSTRRKPTTSAGVMISVSRPGSVIGSPTGLPNCVMITCSVWFTV